LKENKWDVTSENDVKTSKHHKLIFPPQNEAHNWILQYFYVSLLQRSNDRLSGLKGQT
jgi:hypothetical protein